jgi:hypothetical protein
MVCTLPPRLPATHKVLVFRISRFRFAAFAWTRAVVFSSIRVLVKIPHPPRNSIPHCRVGSLCHKCRVTSSHAGGAIRFTARMTFPTLVIADVVVHACRIRPSGPGLPISTGTGRVVRCKRRPSPIGPAPPAPNWNLSLWVCEVNGPVAHVGIEIRAATGELLRIFAQEPASVLVIVARPIFVDSMGSQRMLKSPSCSLCLRFALAQTRCCC